MYESIDNTVYTGRADRVCMTSSSGGNTGPNCQDEAVKVINQFDRTGKGKKKDIYNKSSSLPWSMESLHKRMIVA